MAKILLISDNIDVQTDAQTTLLNHEFDICVDKVAIEDTMQVHTPDIVMIDSDTNNIDFRKLS